MHSGSVLPRPKSFMRVIETTLDEDLSLFSGYLWQQRVRHRVYEERGVQVLEVADATLSGPVREAYQAWKSGRLHLEPRTPEGSAPVSAAPAWRRALTRYPGLTALIALAILVFPFSLPRPGGGLPEVAAWLTIIDLRRPVSSMPSLLELLAELEVWRWVTPILLHFSALHLAFNCAVVIELGRRVERVLRAGGFWLLVLALAVVSNLAQYALGDSPLFGGLSGVAYGLLGFVIAMRRLVPEEPAWHLPPGVAVGLVVFLVLFSTGVTEAFGLYVANAAHWGGFLTGLALGVLRGSRRSA